ncbi:MAG: hypothetical protein HQ515_21645 [Phycisphaeraceae bacterium]|nr:hypothetical protein [Phycisphaeraceae bacterium]
MIRGSDTSPSKATLPSDANTSTSIFTSITSAASHLAVRCHVCNGLEAQVRELPLCIKPVVNRSPAIIGDRQSFTDEKDLTIAGRVNQSGQDLPVWSGGIAALGW